MKFKIHKQELKRIDNEKVASFSRHYVHATFIFDKLWMDLRKFALFVTPNDEKYIVDLKYGKCLTCEVPEEVLKNTFFKVSCFADDLLTTTQETVIISPSGYSDDIDTSDIDTLLSSSTSENEVNRCYHIERNGCNYYSRPQKEFEKDEHIHF